jgi:hypothetical protein
MPVIFDVLTYEDVMLWRPLRQPTVHANALEKSSAAKGSETADVRKRAGVDGSQTGNLDNPLH